MVPEVSYFSFSFLLGLAVLAAGIVLPLGFMVSKVGTSFPLHHPPAEIFAFSAVQSKKPTSLFQTRRD